MKDPAKDIRKAFYDAIKLALAGSFPSVEVFDNVLLAKDHTPRVLLENQTYIEDFDKGDFGGLAGIDIDITDSFLIGTGGNKRIDEISDLITTYIQPQKGMVGVVTSDFKIITARCEIIGFGSISQPIAGKYLIRKILRYKLLIVEND
jgi:hypothetical protein